MSAVAQINLKQTTCGKFWSNKEVILYDITVQKN